MNSKYEAMFIVKSDMTEEQRKTLFSQLHDSVTKNKGEVHNGAVWAEKKKLYFPIKKQHEGLYYLMNFALPTLAVADLRHAYNLNEDILRVLITKKG